MRPGGLVWRRAKSFPLVADLLMPETQELPHEQYRAVLLNSKNVMPDTPNIYQLTLTSAPVRVARGRARDQLAG